MFSGRELRGLLRLDRGYAQLPLMPEGSDALNSTTDVEPPIGPIGELQSRADLVAEAIRSAILSGRLQTGETLVERQLAATLNVSKTPVREALISLSRSGLVTTSPNRGVMVRQLDMDELRSIYQVRLLLEPWAVAQSTRTRPGLAVEAARRALDDAGDAMRRSDRVAASLANRRFHHTLYVGCGNRLVCSTLDDVQDLVTLGILTLLWPRASTWGSEAEEHAAILEAVAASDARRAERLAREHVQRSLARIK
jgi:DNA-binding GntR family transcriptional regulator